MQGHTQQDIRHYTHQVWSLAKFCWFTSHDVGVCCGTQKFWASPFGLGSVVGSIETHPSRGLQSECCNAA